MAVSPAAVEAEAEYDFGFASEGSWQRAGRRFFRHRLAGFSLCLLVALFGVGLFAGHLAPYAHDEVNPLALSQAPSWAHPFGTNQVGQDYFSRVLLALGTEARVTLLIALVIVTLGLFVGTVAGCYGRWLDNILMRATDVFLTMPPLVTLLVAAQYLTITSLYTIAIVIGCVLWMPVARVTRGVCLALREQQYVDAARAMGASDVRIMLRHLVPNAIGPIAVTAALTTAGALILEVTLAYLGFGGLSAYVHRQARTPSIGDVMSSAQVEGLFHWWGLFFPGFALVLVIAPICFIGDGLRDALDPAEARNVRPRKRRVRPGVISRAASRVPLPEIPWYRLRSALVMPLRPLLVGGTATRLGVEAVLERRSRRRRRLVWALLEVTLVFAVMIGAAAGVYAWKVNPTRSPWRVGGTAVTNVSRARGAQTEVSVAAGPRGLFAASNDTLLRTIRVYTSTDGLAWTSGSGPPLGADCARGEPSAAVTPGGRELVAFIVSADCLEFDPSPHLVVASRPAGGGTWLVRRLTAPSQELWDDKPALAAAPDGRVYAVWSRLLDRDTAAIVFSSSRDGGRTWSKPKPISREIDFGQLVSATVAADGTLYVAGVDSHFGIWAARRAPRAKAFAVKGVFAPEDNVASTCMLASYRPIAESANRCLGPNPSVAVMRDRIFVTFAGQPYATDGVTVAVLDRNLDVLSRRRIGPSGGTAQFWPAATVDASTQRLWACYYDTSGDSSRKKAWYVCTSSRNGRTWTTPVRASAESADVTALWEDARIWGFGDEIGYGGYTAVAASNGVVHPFWIDTSDPNGRKQEIFTATLG